MQWELDDREYTLPCPPIYSLHRRVENHELNELKKKSKCVLPSSKVYNSFS